jgi:hypothetical protein
LDSIAHKSTNNLWLWMAGFAQLRSFRRPVAYCGDQGADEQDKRQAEHDLACDEHRGVI